VPQYWGERVGYHHAKLAELAAAVALPLLQFPGAPLLAKQLSPATLLQARGPPFA
jgi:hypothetical protein